MLCPERDLASKAHAVGYAKLLVISSGGGNILNGMSKNKENFVDGELNRY